MEKLLSDFKKDGTCGIQKQIAEFLRKKIESGKIKAEAKLPSLRTLAKLWNTNIFSVKLAMDELVQLGFLSKQQGRGVFVSPPHEKIRCIGIYSSCLPGNLRQELSFQMVQELLCRKFTERSCKYVIWNDYRPEEEHTKPPEEMMRAIVSGEVQAVAGVLLRNCDKKWFFSLPVKKSFLMADRFPEGGWDSIANALQGRKHIAMIASGAFNKHSSFILDSIQNAGIRILPRRRRLLQEKDYLGKDWTKIGYDLAKELLSAKTPPDALVVYPDNMAPGIFYAVQEMGFRVPEDLLLVIHRNLELDYFSPFPVVHIDTKLEDIAERLANSITSAPGESEK